MENGTKAIVIAVSVIVTIITFSIVAILYSGNQTIAKIGAKKIDQAAVNYHNAQFTTYFGKKLSVSEAKILVNKTVSNNERAETNKEDKYIVDLYINNESVDFLLKTIYIGREVELRRKYLVVCTITSDNKYIDINGTRYDIKDYVVSKTSIPAPGGGELRVATKRTNLQRLLSGYVETLGSVFNVTNFTSDEDNIINGIWIESVM